MVRGAPYVMRYAISTIYSGLRTPRQLTALVLYSATGLPIIVAVTQIAASSGLISTTMASTMVTGGAVTVLVFPLIASRLAAREGIAQESGHRCGRAAISRHIAGTCGRGAATE